MDALHLRTEQLMTVFETEKILTKQQILQVLGCSNMTLWRTLKPLDYLTSYNCNARFYTLSRIATFDCYGLWMFRQARFSRHGSLTATTQALVCESSCGLTAAELQERLQVDIKPTLTKLSAKGELAREKIANRFVYLDCEPDSRQQQLRLRSEATRPTALPASDIVIAVLVELIEQVHLSVSEVTDRLQDKAVAIDSTQVEAIFRHYQLREKKRSSC